jgi:hypothetical protein
MDMNNFASLGNSADMMAAEVDCSFEGVVIEVDLTPCQGATQGAVHSAGDCCNDMVESRRDRRPFFGSVVLAEHALDAIDDRLGNLAKVRVAVPITILQACV